MILYGSYTSPFVRHCRIELITSGLDYEFVETDYAASDTGSPTKRVPYLEDSGRKLTDSSSILLHLKNKQGKGFIDTPENMELFAMAGTALDTAINLFLLEKEGQTPENNAYLARQQARVESSLVALDAHDLSMAAPYSIAEIRLGCLLDWGLYRQRFSIEQAANLSAFLDAIRSWGPFAETAPPA